MFRAVFVPSFRAVFRAVFPRQSTSQRLLRVLLVSLSLFCAPVPIPQPGHAPTPRSYVFLAAKVSVCVRGTHTPIHSAIAAICVYFPLADSARPSGVLYRPDTGASPDQLCAFSASGVV